MFEIVSKQKRILHTKAELQAWYAEFCHHRGIRILRTGELYAVSLTRENICHLLWELAQQGVILEVCLLFNEYLLYPSLLNPGSYPPRNQ